MSERSIRDILADQLFIPWYQRDYAWEKEHVFALINDFSDSVHGNYNHYVSSIVMMNRRDQDNHKDLIDGQQRLTTIIMLLKALSDKIGADSNLSRAVNGLLWSDFRNREFILNSPNLLGNANPINENIAFLESLLKDDCAEAKTYAQLNYKTQYENIKSHIQKLDNEFGERLIRSTLDSVATVHEVNDIIEANRIFLTLNSRGKPLTYAEKIKALLIYHASKLKDNAQTISKDIHDKFCIVTSKYHDIDNLIKENGIILRTDGPINEDILLGWHFCFYKKLGKLATAKDAFDTIGAELDECNDSDKKSELINRYAKSVVDFFTALDNLIRRSSVNPLFYEVIAICRLTAIVWPVVIALEHRNSLEKEYEIGNFYLNLIKIIQLVDKIHRLSKAQGRDLIEISYEIYNNENIDEYELIDKLKRYHKDKWSDEYIPSELDESKSDYIAYLLFDATISPGQRNDINFLKHYKRIKATPLRILNIYPDISIRNHGIWRRAYIGQTCNSIGNLVLVSSSLSNKIKELTKVNGHPSPTELKEIILENSDANNLADTTKVLDDIIEDAVINKEYIESRYDSFYQRIFSNWIDPFI